MLNNTGTSGNLTVTGTGTTDGTGGTIQNTTGDGISLTNTQDVNLNNMNVTGADGNGINGNTVNGLVLQQPQHLRQRQLDRRAMAKAISICPN